MLEQAIRHHYQYWLVDPVAREIHKFISPIHVTTLSLLFGIGVLPMLIYHQTTLSIIFLFISGYLDTLDGTLARHTNSTSAFGAVYDIMTDRIVEFSAIFGLWFVDPHQRSFMCLLMLGSVLFCVTSFLVVGIFTPNDSSKGFHYSPGLIERAEAFIFFSLMILFAQYFTLFASGFTILVLLTTYIRLHEFKKYHHS